VLTIISIDFLFNETHREAIENLSKYPPFQNLASGLLITFLVCLIGNLLPIPTPYTFVVCFSSLPFLQLNLIVPMIVALVASLGCLFGELAGYFIGRGVSEFISEEQRKKLKDYQHFLVEHPKIAPFAIFFAALTPISDDLIIFPLGLIKYSFKKSIFWCWLGKLGMMLIFSYNFLNICSLLGGESWIQSIVSLYVMLVSLYFILKINLLDLVKKYARRKSNKKL
jgi:membrane protein YqaA with SNARE-associated domain